MQFLKRSLVAGLAASLLLAAPVWAQETGSISGIVTDPDGAPLPGVSVTMESSIVPTSTVYTQANGAFRFPVLPPAADYRVTFQLEGFKTIISDQIPVRVGGNSQQNLMMELSTVEETVTVTGTTPIVDVKSTTIQNNINQQYMQGVPSARDPWVMLEQTAAVQINKEDSAGLERLLRYCARHVFSSKKLTWLQEGEQLSYTLPKPLPNGRFRKGQRHVSGVAE